MKIIEAPIDITRNYSILYTIIIEGGMIVAFRPQGRVVAVRDMAQEAVAGPFLVQILDFLRIRRVR